MKKACAGGTASPSLPWRLRWPALAEGYSKGWIDPTTLTNGTNDCREQVL